MEELNLEGSLGGGALVDALLRLARGGEKGILTIQSEQDIVGLSVVDGQVMSADALNQTVEEGLGAVLAERGTIGPEEFGNLVAEHQAGGGRVIDLLVERNYLSQNALLDALRTHIYRLCRLVLSWDSGEYKFYRGDDVSHEAELRPLPVEEIILRASRDLGTEGPLAGPVPDDRTVYERTEMQLPGGDPEDSLRGILTGKVSVADAGAHALMLLEQVDGEISAGELAISSTLPDPSAIFLLFRLQEAQLLRPKVGVAPPPSPAAAVDEPLASAPAPAVAPREEAPSRRRRRQKRAKKPRTRAAPAAPVWPGRLLAVGLALMLVGVLVTRPVDLFLPFSWHDDLQRAMIEGRRNSVYYKLDYALKTVFLLEGHFPQNLTELSDRRLAGTRDLMDPSGGPLTYSATPSSYRLNPFLGEDLGPGASFADSITGNFLLDPEFVAIAEDEPPPLILLD